MSATGAVALEAMKARATRIALLGQFLESIESARDRKRVVMALWEVGIVSDYTAELFIEFYGLESA